MIRVPLIGSHRGLVSVLTSGCKPRSSNKACPPVEPNPFAPRRVVSRSYIPHILFLSFVSTRENFNRKAYSNFKDLGVIDFLENELRHPVTFFH
jgi:hypothetical protein